MDEAEVLRALWERFEARDWEGAAALVAEDVVLEWPHSRERIRGRDRLIALNRNYPEGWRIEVARVWRVGPGCVASLVRVHFRGAAEWALSVWELREGRLWRGVETWAAEHAAPAWRAAWVEPMD